MEFTLTKSSDTDFRKKITINSLEELLGFIEKTEDESVIIFSNRVIEIYDDFREL